VNCPITILAVLINPQQHGICGLIDAPFRLLVPKRVRKLARWQKITESCAQTNQIEPLALDILNLVFPRVHEQRKIKAGEYIGRELREICVPECRSIILVATAPKEPWRKIAPQL